MNQSQLPFRLVFLFSPALNSPHIDLLGLIDRSFLSRRPPGQRVASIFTAAGGKRRGSEVPQFLKTKWLNRVLGTRFKNPIIGSDPAARSA
jgi:hypothetical protein